MTSNKAIVILIAVVVMNVAWWGFSEVYIEGGDLVYGLVVGCVSSVVSILVPVLVLSLLK